MLSFDSLVESYDHQNEGYSAWRNPGFVVREVAKLHINRERESGEYSFMNPKITGRHNLLQLLD